MATNDKVQITVKGARLSFQKLFVPEGFKGSTENKKYGATFLLDKQKDAHAVKALEDAVAELLKDKGEKGKPLKLAAEKIALKDGGHPDYAEKKGYGPGIVFIAASNADKVPVVDQQRKPIEADKNVNPHIKSGDYVNAVITLKFQNNTYGKRVNAYLGAVQLVRKGEALGAAAVDPDEAFDEVPFDDGDDEV